MRNNRKSLSTHILALCTLALMVATPSLTEAVVAPIFYDPSTGNLTMDVTNAPGGVMGGYSLKSPGGLFISSSHTRFVDTQVFTTLPTEIGEAQPFGNLAPGVYSAGNVLPTGMSETQVLDVLDLGNSIWVGGLGTGTNTFGLVYGPSPFPALNDPNAPPPVVNWASEATLIYNPINGNLSLDLTGTTGGAIAGYQLASDTNSFVPSEFQPAGTLGYFDAFTDLIVEAEYAGIADDLYDLGNILPAGLTLGQLETHLTSAKFLSAPGHGLNDFDIETNGVNFSLQLASAIAPVPEPSTYVLASLGLLGFAFLARRRTLTAR